jgi:hypothetical protein
MGYEYKEGNSGSRWSLFIDNKKKGPELDDDGKEIVPF